MYSFMQCIISTTYLYKIYIFTKGIGVERLVRTPDMWDLMTDRIPERKLRKTSSGIDANWYYI